MDVIVGTGITVNVYFNTVESSTGGVTHSHLVNPFIFNRIGSYSSVTTNYMFNGKLANMSIYNRALTATELGKYYNETQNKFKNTPTNSKILSLDVSNTQSYPGSGTSVMDLSGVGNNGTLVNGVGFNSNGYFEFDGVDDYIEGGIVQPQYYTLSSWFKSTGIDSQGDQYGGLLIANDPLYSGGNIQYSIFYSWYSQRIVFYTQGNVFSVTPNITILRNTLYNVTCTYDGSNKKIYINGELINTTANTTDPVYASTGNRNVQIGRWGYAQYLRTFNGNIYKTQIYDKALTQAQVLQNYYQAPIVTDGLVYSIDAGNLVSFENGETTAYSLTGSNDSTLTNGVGFDSNNDGSWSFDGVDDYINAGTTGLDFGGGNFNVSLWINTTQNNAAYTGVIAKYASNVGLWIQLNPTTKNVWFGWSGTTYLTSTTSVNNGVWRYISCQRTGDTTAEIYVDGILVASGAGKTGSSNTAQTLDVGRINLAGRYFDGDISNVQLYDRALTATEVLQNYNSQQSRFS
jgi:hypothetical protein